MNSKLQIWVSLCALLAGALTAAPVVSNVVVAQRAESKLVDLSYDLSGAGASGAIIEVELSDDSGASYTVSAPSLSGDQGSGISNGTSKQIVWDAGADKPNFVSDSMRFRLIVSEESFVPLPAESFALIPAGSFTMGDSLDGLSDTPTHSVQVSGFYMGKHEVSWQLWQEVRDWAASNGYDIGSGGSGKGEQHPVRSVSWYDVVKWCNAASERAGLEPVYYLSGAVYRSGESTPDIDYSKQGYRLPTEAEWEKAARGGESGQRFPWGDTISHTHANYYETTSSSYSYESGDGTGYHPSYTEGGSPYTAPVGSFAANGYGLYNMIGNVWEWCNDWYDSGYYSSSPGTDPQGPSTGSFRVPRGGSWISSANFCRVSIRNYSNYPDYRNSHYGFRLALSQ